MNEWAKCDTHFTKQKMVEADKQTNKKKIYLKRLHSKRNDLTLDLLETDDNNLYAEFIFSFVFPFRVILIP